MRKTFCQSALALTLLGGAVLATAPAFAGYRHIYLGPPAVVAPPVVVAVPPPVAVVPPVVAVEPYAPEVIGEPVAPVAPPVVGYAPPVPVAPEAEFDYGPPAGPALEVGGY